MDAEIISIGTELTTGQNLDTNSQWLSLRLAELGIAVGWHTTVADELEANTEVLRIATGRAKIVIVTGGLGPTLDDLTRDVLARLAGVPLVFHNESYAQIAALFALRKRPMPERNRVQAMFPEGAEPIENTCGTAPGIWMRHGDSVIACMPGVPSEMFTMFERDIVPRLRKLGLAGGVRIQRKLNCFGSGESHIEAMLPDVTRRGAVPDVGITASDATISLRIFGTGADRAAALAQIAPVEQTIRERLGTLVFGADQEELQEVVVRLLLEKRLTLATAESVTAGLIAHRLGQVPGASGCFLGGVIAYSNALKMELLAVPSSLIEEHGVISLEVAKAMAVGCRTRLRSDLAISAVGIAGPGGATADKPVGLVHLALAHAGSVEAIQFSWTGTRQEVQSRTAKLALNMVRLHLLK